MKVITTSLVSVAAALAFSANSAVYVPKLEVQQTKVIDTNTGNTTVSYAIDGIDIELTKEDKIKAKNWNLKNSDWVKYKYAIAYTPRGIWTPNLDPPIVLGNLATTDAERTYYGRIMNNLESNRRAREAAFQLAANKVNRLDNVGLQNVTPPRKGLSKVLPEQFQKLRSIFLDIDDCDSDCKTFITLAIASTSSVTKLDIHATNGSEKQVFDLLGNLGMGQDEIESRKITIKANRNNPLVEKFRNGGKIPFYINRNESETTRYHIQ